MTDDFRVDDQPLVTVRRGWIEDKGTTTTATCEKCGWSRELAAYSASWPLHEANAWAIAITDHLASCGDT